MTINYPKARQGLPPSPPPYQVWDTTYPSGRDGAATGWTCPGCGRGYSPSVAACWICPVQPADATGANSPPTDVEAGLITQQQKDLSSDQGLPWHPCLKPLEGGMCGCGEGGD